MNNKNEKGVKSATNKSFAVTKLYKTLKEKHSDALLLFHVGEFYELFFEDAQTAGKILGLTLTKADRGEKEPLNLCGFAASAFEGYLQKLVKAGKRVAIVEELHGTRGAIKREVKRVEEPEKKQDKAVKQEEIKPAETDTMQEILQRLKALEAENESLKKIKETRPVSLEETRKLLAEQEKTEESLQMLRDTLKMLDSLNFDYENPKNFLKANNFKLTFEYEPQEINWSITNAFEIAMFLEFLQGRIKTRITDFNKRLKEIQLLFN